MLELHENNKPMKIMNMNGFMCLIEMQK